MPLVRAEADEGVAESVLRARPQRLTVARRTAASPRGVDLAEHGSEHDAELDLPLERERDRDAPVRQPVQKVGGAVDRVDDPEGTLRWSAVLLSEHAVFR